MFKLFFTLTLKFEFCRLLVTLVPEVFLDFSPPEMREPRSGDRCHDIMSRYYESRGGEKVFLPRRFATRNIVTSIAASELDIDRSPLRSSLISGGEKSRKTSGTRVTLFRNTYIHTLLYSSPLGALPPYMNIKW